MAAIRAQVEYLANLQGRSANLIALAEQNAVGRANIREKITEISEQVKRVADVLEMARNVAEEVAGANATQEAHLNALQSALDTAPNAEVLNQEMKRTSATLYESKRTRTKRYQ